MKSATTCRLDLAPDSCFRAMVLVCLGLLLGACATPVPGPLQGPGSEVSVAQARSASQPVVGARVRWGGRLVGVVNKADHTRLEILAFPLDRAGRPRVDGEPQGRFMARVPGFLEPAVYARGREVSVVGRITGTRDETIGEYPYRFPLVDVSGHFLWPVHTEPAEIHHHDHPPLYPRWPLEAPWSW